LNITYVGHATTLIETDGIRLLTDPLLRRRVMHLQRKGMTLEPDLLEQIDAVLISHLHWDHLHLPSLRGFDPHTRLVVPVGSASLFRKEGFQEIEELPVGGVTQVGPVAVEGVHALHDGSRVFSKVTADSLGFIVHGKQTVYFAGDTDIFPEMASLIDQLDVALLPVWGWGPTLGAGHMNPYRAAMALKLLSPRVAIPIHWGTLFPIGFNLVGPSFLHKPPQDFARYARSFAPNVDVQIVEPGASAALGW
jgi:L-ascorbate metabolism protein UlaG (beta-lactamase superfamily)